jgi:glycine/D-amino acid oxidase-like deaminating enzyme
MMVDYLIVGAGLAGISFAELALENSKSILVLDNHSQNSSRIAGGLYNPVILKRFSEVWNAQEQLHLSASFYKNVEDKLKITVDYSIPILRKFFSIEEQNNWFAASDKVNLAPFLSLDLISKVYNGIDAPFGYGEVLQTGYVDTATLLNSYHSFLRQHSLFIEDAFTYTSLDFKEDYVQYQQYQAKHVIFAEGFGMHANPYFNYLPLDGTKGELFIIKAPDLDLNVIINTSVFILPLGNQLFKVGATYNWKDKTCDPTEEGKLELVARLNEILDCDFEIIEHFAGVRPTVRDRKPLVGTHSVYKQLHVLNGLGTRGVMLGPAMAKVLYENIEFQIPISPEIDIRRYDNKF